MLLGMSLRLWAGLAVAALVAGGLAWSHASAYRAGRAAERTAVIERSLEILRERAETDADVADMDDDDLCRALGGVPVDGRCE